MIVTRLPVVFLLSFVCTTGAALAQRPPADTDQDTRETRHQTYEWQSLSPHLPDPKTGTPQSLEVAGDVLRARRMPEDALDYYGYAMQRGGDEATLWNRIGVTELELRQTDAARAAFKRAIQLKAKDGKNWNNLGSAEFVAGNLKAALNDYSRAVKLDKKAAVYRSNLGSAYFELKDYDSARKEFQKAAKLDHNVFRDEGVSGFEAHVLSLSDRGRFCFEMAKIAAKQKDDAAVLRWLAQASENGFDIRTEMADDRDFQAYRKDARVDLIVRNAKAMRTRQMAAAGPMTPLPDAPPPR